MFDTIEDRIIFSQKEIYKNKKHEKEESKYNAEKRINEIESICPHNLVLSYFVEITNPIVVKRANCLVCGKNLELEDTIDINSGKEINKELIIDVTDKVSLYSQNLFVGDINILVIKAQEVLKNIMYDSHYKTLSEIKEIIENELISYNKELRGKKLLKKY